MNASVIIAAYNAANVISRAITSVLDQTFSAHEIIIIDDHSTDGTRDIVHSFVEENPQIKLLSLATNVGPAAARNIGLAAVQGEWVAILDADDAWRPRRLARMLEIAESREVDF